MSNINPCPFCGCNHTGLFGNYDSICVICRKCDARGPRVRGNSQKIFPTDMETAAWHKEVIAAWNNVKVNP